MQKTIIGLEAHDGCGKSTTASNLVALFGGLQFDTEKHKESRRPIYRKNIPKEQMMQEIHQTYLAEKEDFLLKSLDHNFCVLDRTWLSHAVEENVIDLEKNNQSYPTFSHESGIPSELVVPDLIFQIILPEDERKKRVSKRDEKLTKRDIKLAEDEAYREHLDAERKKFGCIPLRLRLRDEKVCALRAAQIVLSSETTPPMNVNLSGFID